MKFSKLLKFFRRPKRQDAPQTKTPDVTAILPAGTSFDRVETLVEGASIEIGYIGRHPYFINKDDGSIVDPFRMEETDFAVAQQKIMNWTMPGLQFLYRDTDAPLDVAGTFRVGDTLRAGIFLDTSPYAGRPMHRYRYIIASAHAANLSHLPPVHYPLYVLHYNSYLQVKDIYEKDGVTQICLLHVPAKSIFVPGFDNLEVRFSDGTNAWTLVEKARKSLDQKLAMPPRDLLEEDEWLDRTSAHVGIDDEGKPYSLIPQLFVADERAQNMGQMVRKMAMDTDPINLFFDNQ